MHSVVIKQWLHVPFRPHQSTEVCVAICSGFTGISTVMTVGFCSEFCEIPYICMDYILSIIIGFLSMLLCISQTSLKYVEIVFFCISDVFVSKNSSAYISLKNVQHVSREFWSISLPSPVACPIALGQLSLGNAIHLLQICYSCIYN